MSCKNGMCKDLDEDFNDMNCVYDDKTKVITLFKKDIFDKDLISPAESKRFKIKTVSRYDDDCVTLDEDKRVAIISIPALEDAFGVEISEVKIK